MGTDMQTSWMAFPRSIADQMNKESATPELIMIGNGSPDPPKSPVKVKRRRRNRRASHKAKVKAAGKPNPTPNPKTVISPTPIISPRSCGENISHIVSSPKAMMEVKEAPPLDDMKRFAVAPFMRN